MADGSESNWWPGAPQPNGRPGGYGDPRTSGARGGQPPWDQPAQPPSWEQQPGQQPSWDQPARPSRGSAGDQGGARGPQRADPRYSDPRSGDPRYSDSDPRHGNPRNSPPGPQDQEQRGWNPGPDQGRQGWMPGSGPEDRPRRFRGDPEADPYPAASRGRHRTEPPGTDSGYTEPGRTGSEESRGPGRTMAWVGGGALVAIALVAAVLGLSRGGATGNPTAQVTESTGVGPTLDAAGTGPGAPAVTARSAGGQQVEFSWTYANAAAGDTFQVQVSGAGKPTTVDKPDIVLTAAQGQKTCVQVQVVSANGTASPESSQACWPG